ncbi:MAG: hypothetical protein HY329_24060 [Chloroflexi bacterium]|nr:hypothetical protein [Chloroflexota bacterium]
MGTFNELVTDAACPLCGRLSSFSVQFRYGQVWQHVYRLGDEVIWGDPSVGNPSLPRVLVEGIAGPCVACGADFIEFDVLIADNKLLEVRPLGVEREAFAPEGYVVLRD